MNSSQTTREYAATCSPAEPADPQPGESCAEYIARIVNHCWGPPVRVAAFREGVLFALNTCGVRARMRPGSDQLEIG